MRPSDRAWTSGVNTRRMATGATVALMAAGSFLWMIHIRSSLTGEENRLVPRVTVPRLDGIMISGNRRAGLLNGSWIAEGSELRLDGVCWRLRRIDAGAAVLSCGQTDRRIRLSSGETSSRIPAEVTDRQGRRL